MDAKHSIPSPSTELLGESPPEHGLPGRALILLIHAAGTASSVGLFIGDNLSWAERAARLPFACLMAITIALVAEGLRRFDCIAWFFVMGSLGLTLFFMVMIALFDAPLRETAGAWGVFVFIVGWMRYLWLHRQPFWADPPTRPSRHRAERWVTPEWRAARLGRMAEDGGRSSAVPPRAETVRRNPA
jgi:hypothetical protein